MARYYLDFTFCSLSNRWSILKNECEATVNAVRAFFVLFALQKVWATASKHCTDVSIIMIIIILDHAGSTRCPTLWQGS